MNKILVGLVTVMMSMAVLSACGDPQNPKNPNEGHLKGKTQVFNVDTPHGQYQCITWKSGYGGGLDCDYIQ